jgi:hypothetical protein
MRKALVLIVVLLATTCFADSFQIDGTLTSPGTGNRVGTFAATIEINTATGSIVSWYIAMPSIPPGFGEPGIGGFTFTPSNSTASFFGGELELLNSARDRNLYLVIPNKTLIGFTGSAFGGGYGDPRSQFGAFYDASGTIATPEPSSLLLFCSGLAGMFAFRRKLFGGTLQHRC